MHAETGPGKDGKGMSKESADEAASDKLLPGLQDLPPAVKRRVKNVPLEVQQDLAFHGVQIADRTGRTELLLLHQLTKHQARQLFTRSGEIRTVAEQVKWLEECEKRMAERIPRGP